MRRFFVSLCLGTALFAGAGLGTIVPVGTASAQQSSVASQSAVSTLSYQGVLSKDGVAVPDGDYTITATLYRDGLGASSVWSGTYVVHTSNGVFNVLLGSGDYQLPAASQLDGALFLGVKIGQGAELPLTQLSSALSAMNVADGSITARKMGTDYVGAISVNGQRFSARGGNVNIVTGDGMVATTDQSTNSIVLSAAGGSSGLAGKGANTENSNTSYIINQYGVSPYQQQTNAFFNISGMGIIGGTDSVATTVPGSGLVVGKAGVNNHNSLFNGNINVEVGKSIS